MKQILLVDDGGRLMDQKPLRHACVLGARATLEKPFDSCDLRDTIWNLLEPEPDSTACPRGGDS